MKSTATLLCCLWLPAAVWLQDCGVTIQLDPQIDLCAPGSALLSPSVTGNYLSFTWLPSSGLSAPSQLTTSATVSSNTTYTLQVNSLGTANLIVNGDFSMGDTGFTSDYIYGTGGGVGLLSNEGQYAIADDAGDTHNQFAHCSDHTGGGNMMVVNASGDASNIWCQNISVTPNTTYQFSAWVTSVVSQNPAQLQFSVNGQLLGAPYNASAATCNWQNFTAQWSAGMATNAQICIANTNFTPAGNDFALDDISFREICVTTAAVDIVIHEVDASLAVPAEICRANTSINPSDFLVAGATPGGSWQLDGQPITTFNPANLTGSTHVLAYTVSEAGCTDMAQAVFNVVQPPAAGSDAMVETCLAEGDSYTVALANLLSGEDMGGSWSLQAFPVGASPVLAGGQFTAGVSGSYILQYEVSGSGVCPADSSLVTVLLQPTPALSLPTTATLDCLMPQVELSAIVGNLNNNNAAAFWSYNGQPIFDASSYTWTATAAGVYTLQVTNEDNGCSATTDVSVADFRDEINFEVWAQQADCTAPNTGSLGVANITGGTPPYLSSLNGAPFTPTDAYMGLSPGSYTIVVQDAGGCELVQDTFLETPMIPEVMIFADTALPLDLGSTARLTLAY
ncbi:MAG: hypothetical protein R2795_20645 [Saprospiraceae bacterium]